MQYNFDEPIQTLPSFKYATDGDWFLNLIHNYHLQSAYILMLKA